MGVAPFMSSMNTLQDLNKLADSLSNSDRMPALFLGHGSPMNAIEENQFVKGFREAGRAIEPAPKAILCISAHWFTKGTMVTAMESPKTIHDFYGFPKELFAVQYPAPGNPELAEETAKILSGYDVDLDHEWGLDHGAWSVIKHMYPEANIPVIQLSIDYTKPPSYHFELAQRLAQLRDKGVLIIGSGNIVHNLRMIDWKGADLDDHGYDWAREARAKINELLVDGNIDPLLAYQNQGQAWNLAIPSPDHFLPLIYTIGLQGKSDNLSLFNDKLVMGSISMTSVVIG